MKIENKKFGYARCSTTKQDVSYCLKYLLDRGVPRNHIYIEYISGTKTRNERPEFDKLMTVLENNPYSELISSDLTRVARNITDIEELANIIKKYHLKLDAGLVIDCRNKEMDITSELILYIISIFANFEVKLRKRQIYLGLERAVANGKRLGRPSLSKEVLENDPKFLKYYLQWKEKRISLSEMARLYGCCRNSCRNKINVFEEKS